MDTVRTVSAEREHFDVLIVGAGLSGIGAASHLKARCPSKSFVILEARETIGGTWDLFRYPGIRSDSDMFTLGYSFKPWREPKAIADGPSILRYIKEAAEENGLVDRIRLGRRVVAADWCSATARWNLEVATSSGGTEELTCSFLYANTGYYRYDEGYSPRFEGSEHFGGPIVHPQHWPEDLDYAGKRVVVIGSGATAVTLVPAMAETAAHVTMLQRSPSYIASLPARDPLADLARSRLPAELAYSLLRWKNVLLAMASYQLSRRAPRFMRSLLTKGVARHLPPDFDVATHFTPRYDPWDQRLCLVPDADLFKAISAGRVSVVTDHVEGFTGSGILLASGGELEADVVVTATGLNMLVLGGMRVLLDGEPVELATTVGYKGMMFSGLPNLAATMGYTNASWTLKADLAAEYVCRLLGYMDSHGYRVCVPEAPDPSLPTEPFVGLASGYVLRSVDSLPRQGARTPWRLHQNYLLDLRALRHGRIADEGISFHRDGRDATEGPRRTVEV